MKNKEKFAKEIVEIACDGDDIAIDKRTGKVSSCTHVPCSNCLFCKNGCAKGRRKWAESEYIEKPLISKKDRAFLDYLRPEWEYMARDNDERLRVFFEKPIKARDVWNYDVSIGAYNLSYGLIVDFPMVKWSDKEPWLIEDLKKLEVVENYE